jgi:5'-nucleotidase
VNIPDSPGGPEVTCITFPAIRQYNDSVSLRGESEGNASYSLEMGETYTEPERGSDWDAISRNCVSISPVFLHPVVRRDRCDGVPDHAGVGKRPGKSGKR